MMGVIVNVAVLFVVDANVETTFHAFESRQGFGDGFWRKPDLSCRDKSCGGVKHVVVARHGQTDLRLLTFTVDDKVSDALLRLDDFGAVVATRPKTEADAFVGTDVQAFLDDDFLLGESGKVVEAFHQVLLVAIDVEVVGIDRVDDADFGTEVEEGAVELVGFDDEKAFLFLTEQQVALKVVGDTSDEGSGALSTVIQDVGNHSRGGGLAVCACHGYGEVMLRDLP